MDRLDRVGDLDQLAGGDVGIGEAARFDELYAAARSSLSTPRPTIFNVSSGSGRCNAFASSHGARIQTSRSSSVVKITGMGLRVDRLDDGVRRCRQEAVDKMVRRSRAADEL
jgi:hypothetical protein